LLELTRPGEESTEEDGTEGAAAEVGAGVGDELSAFPPPFLLSGARDGRGVICGFGLKGAAVAGELDRVPDCVATEFLRSARDEVEGAKDDELPTPPLVPGPSLCCFRNRIAEEEGVSAVGVARPELGGLCEGCLREEISMVGDGRLGIGVSMVEGSGMDDGFERSSLLLPAPLEASSFSFPAVDFSSVTTSSVAFLCTCDRVKLFRIASTSPAAGTQACRALSSVDGAICTLLPYRQRSL
jgi:hypothetical protein